MDPHDVSEVYSGRRPSGTFRSASMSPRREQVTASFRWIGRGYGVRALNGSGPLVPTI